MGLKKDYTMLLQQFISLANRLLCDIISVMEKEKLGSLIPPSGSAIFQRYLWEINKYPVLTAKQEAQLARLYHKHRDRDAAFRLITSNLRLVVKIALEFQNFWASNLMDLIQEGNIGLMMALKKYDYDKGVRFSYYAAFWVKAYVLKFILDNWRLVKIGTTQAQRRLFYNLHKEKQKLTQLGYQPFPQLIAKRLNVSEKDVVEMEQRMGMGEVSLDASLGSDTEDNLQEILPSKEVSPEESLADSEVKMVLRKKLDEFKNELTDREQDILKLRLLAEEPITLKAIGKRYNISRERIRQIEGRLMKRLKKHLQKEWPDYKDAFRVSK